MYLFLIHRCKRTKVGKDKRRQINLCQAKASFRNIRDQEDLTRKIPIPKFILGSIRIGRSRQRIEYECGAKQEEDEPPTKGMGVVQGMAHRKQFREPNFTSYEAKQLLESVGAAEGGGGRVPLQEPLCCGPAPHNPLWWFCEEEQDTAVCWGPAPSHTPAHPTLER